MAKKKRRYIRKPKPVKHSKPLSNIYYTSAEVARMFRTTVRVLGNWRKKELLPGSQFNGGPYLYNYTDVEEFKNNNRGLG